MRMYGRLALHAESVVLPLLAADAPVVTWWHSDPPERLTTDALAVIADRRITDSAVAGDQLTALRTRAKDYAPGDTDLAWTRVTGWRATLTSALDSVSGRRGDAVRIVGGHIEGDPGAACAQLLAGWIESRSGSRLEVVQGARHPGPTGVDSVVLQLDQDEEVRVHTDRRGGAVISQPYRPDATMALSDRSLGDLLGEELRRLDPDEPYAEALEVSTGTSGLTRRAPLRSHVWVDPAEQDGGPTGGALDADAVGENSPHGAAPTVPPTSEGTDEVALAGEHDTPDPTAPEPETGAVR
jgi:glucose-6-phosphate dehydrogenase assembly protein OpcA